MKFAALARSAALVTAVALIPATTASMAQVDGRAGAEFSKVLGVYQRIKASYVDPVDDETLMRGMIDGMLAALDPHSGYLDGSDLQRLETMIDGNYSGLGLSVVAEDGAVKVIAPFKDTPAYRAGVKGRVSTTPRSATRILPSETLRQLPPTSSRGSDNTRISWPSAAPLRPASARAAPPRPRYMLGDRRSEE